MRNCKNKRQDKVVYIDTSNFIPRVLARLEYLWDIQGVLCEDCRKEKDKVFSEGKFSFEEMLWWKPDANCPEYKPVAKYIEDLDTHPEEH